MNKFQICKTIFLSVYTKNLKCYKSLCIINITNIKKHYLQLIFDENNIKMNVNYNKSITKATGIFTWTLF